MLARSPTKIAIKADRTGGRHHQNVAQERTRDEYRPLGGPPYGLDICHYSLSARARRARAHHAF